jgi:hypothetical protein
VHGKHSQMPPAGKRKARPQLSGSGGADGGGADGADAGGAQEEGTARGLKPLVVKEFIGMLQRRDRLGPDYFSDVEKQQWNEWLDAVPGSAAESLDAKSLLPVRMPRKCLPRPAAGSSSAGPSSMEQQEIISYANAGGRQFGAEARRRQYLSQKPLQVSDVPPGSTVAVHCDPQQAIAPGYRTPFWVGDVVEAVGDAAGAKVHKVIIHFRMAQAAGGLFCDDATKPWNLACHAQHTYSKTCERGKACMAAAREAGATTAKLTYTCEPAEIIETKLELNLSNTLKASTKRRLAESAPQKGAWDKQLGI